MLKFFKVYSFGPLWQPCDNEVTHWSLISFTVPLAMCQVTLDCRKDVLTWSQGHFARKAQFAEFHKTVRYACSHCEKTVHVRDNSFSGSSNESIANILVKKMSSLRLLVLKIEFCPNKGKGVAVFAIFANIFEFVTSLLWYLKFCSRIFTNSKHAKF